MGGPDTSRIPSSRFPTSIQTLPILNSVNFAPATPLPLDILHLWVEGRISSLRASSLGLPGCLSFPFRSPCLHFRVRIGVEKGL